MFTPGNPDRIRVVPLRAFVLHTGKRFQLLAWQQLFRSNVLNRLPSLFIVLVLLAVLARSKRYLWVVKLQLYNRY